MSIALKTEMGDYKEFMVLTDTFGGLVENEWQAIVADMAALAYQGFDPAEFMKYLQYVYERNNSVNPNTVEKKVRAANFKKAVYQALSYYVMCGTKMTEKRLAHTDETGVNLWETVKRNFTVIEGTPKQPTDVTIQRIAATFPHWLGNMYYLGLGEVRVPGGYNADLPNALHFSVAPAIIPTTAEYANIRSQYFKWAIEFDKAINGPRADAEVVYGYFQIQQQSTFFKTDARLKVMASYKIDPAAAPAPVAELNSALDKFMKGTLNVKSRQPVSGGEPAKPTGIKPVVIKK